MIAERWVHPFFSMRRSSILQIRVQAWQICGIPIFSSFDPSQNHLLFRAYVLALASEIQNSLMQLREPVHPGQSTGMLKSLQSLRSAISRIWNNPGSLLHAIGNPWVKASNLLDLHPINRIQIIFSSIQAGRHRNSQLNCWQRRPRQGLHIVWPPRIDTCSRSN